jgi:hypothetical protein
MKLAYGLSNRSIFEERVLHYKIFSVLWLKMCQISNGFVFLLIKQNSYIVLTTNDINIAVESLLNLNI